MSNCDFIHIHCFKAETVRAPKDFFNQVNAIWIYMTIDINYKITHTLHCLISYILGPDLSFYKCENGVFN